MGELTKLPNIGKELEKVLLLAGIKTVDDLLKTGSKETFIRIKTIDPEACLDKLYAIEGACQNIRWHLLDKEMKRELKDLFDKLSERK
jgi:DNA transformation protein and related proteins